MEKASMMVPPLVQEPTESPQTVREPEHCQMQLKLHE